MKRVLLIIGIILIIALIAGIAYWYFVLSQKPPSDIAPGPTAKPTPGVGFGSLRPYAYLCANLQKTEAKIPCEKAVELALAQAPGKVKNISVGSIRTSVPSSSGGIERRTVDMWLIDIVLAKPYFDEKLNKQISILQIGIPTDGYDRVFKKPVE